MRRWLKIGFWGWAPGLLVLVVAAILHTSGYWTSGIASFINTAFSDDWRESTVTILVFIAGGVGFLIRKLFERRAKSKTSPVSSASGDDAPHTNGPRSTSGLAVDPVGSRLDSVIDNQPQEPPRPASASTPPASIAIPTGPLGRYDRPGHPNASLMRTVNPSAADLKGASKAPAQFRVIYLNKDGPLWDDRRFILGLENYGKGDAADVFLHPLDDRSPTKATHWDYIPAGETVSFQLEPHEHQYRWKTRFEVTWLSNQEKKQASIELKAADER